MPRAEKSIFSARFSSMDPPPLPRAEKRWCAAGKHTGAPKRRDSPYSFAPLSFNSCADSSESCYSIFCPHGGGHGLSVRTLYRKFPEIARKFHLTFPVIFHKNRLFVIFPYRHFVCAAILWQNAEIPCAAAKIAETDCFHALCGI